MDHRPEMPGTEDVYFPFKSQPIAGVEFGIPDNGESSTEKDVDNVSKGE
jgi:hypothetical protein